MSWDPYSAPFRVLGSPRPDRRHHRTLHRGVRQGAPDASRGRFADRPAPPSHLTPDPPRLTGEARLQVGPAAGPSWAVFNFPSGKIELNPVFLTLKAQDLGGEEAPPPRPDQQGEKGPQLM